MDDNTQPNGHIDYREAFVLDMEMAAHGPNCNTCMLAALKGKQNDMCDRMKHMQRTIRRAYEALPPYYKNRYESAMNIALTSNADAIRAAGDLG